MSTVPTSFTNLNPEEQLAFEEADNYYSYNPQRGLGVLLSTIRRLDLALTGALGFAKQEPGKPLTAEEVFAEDPTVSEEWPDGRPEEGEPDATEQLAHEIHVLLHRTRRESDISVAAAIGVLEMAKLALFQDDVVDADDLFEEE